MTAVSIVVVLIAPVVVCMCILSTLSILCPFHPALLPDLAIITAPQIYTAYSIFGTTTQLYSLHMRHDLIPREGLTNQ